MTLCNHPQPLLMFLEHKRPGLGREKGMELAKGGGRIGEQRLTLRYPFNSVSWPLM